MHEYFMKVLKQFRNKSRLKRKLNKNSEIIKNNFAYEFRSDGGRLEVALGNPTAVHKMLNYLFFPKTFPVFIKLE